MNDAFQLTAILKNFEFLMDSWKNWLVKNKGMDTNFKNDHNYF